MKIVFTTKIYLPHMGGVEIYIRDISRKLISEGNQVTVITADEEVKKVVIEQIENAKVIRIPCKSYAGIYILKKKNDIRVIEHELPDADVVHVNDCKFLFSFFAKRKHKYNYKLILSSHGWLFHTKNHHIVKKWYFKNIVKKYSLYYDKIICVSKQDENIAKEYGIKNTIIINSGSDLEKYASLKIKDDFEYKIFYWGRICPNKGIVEFLERFAELPEKYTLKMAGLCDDEDYLRKIKGIIEIKNVASRISMLGGIYDEQIKECIEEADIIALPSLHEGFGVTLVECLQSGRIIVANQIESYKNILESVGMVECLFDFGDRNSSFERKIEELRVNMPQPKEVQQYSVDQMIVRTIRWYTE